MGKVVQTVLEEAEYNQLEEASKKIGETIKEAVRGAVRSEEKSGIIKVDAIFTFRAASWGDGKASAKIEQVVYGESQ